MKNLILHEIENDVEMGSFTCDGWKSNSSHSHLSTTFHYIDKFFLYQSKCLALRYVPDSKTAEYLYDNLKTILYGDWKLNNKVIIIFIK